MPDKPTAGNGYYSVRAEFGFPGKLEAMLMTAVANAATLLPNTVHALEGLAAAGRQVWVEYAAGIRTLPDGRRVQSLSGTYADSIEYGSAAPQDDAFIRYEIFSTDPKAAWLEYGTNAFDMKKALHTSHQVRQDEDGKKYLIIPFRWGTPGTIAVGAYVGREMPAPVYSFWLSDPRPLISEVTGTFSEPSILDPNESATRYTYRWGDRMTGKDLEALGLDPESAPGKHMVGMVRMRNFPNEQPEPGFQHQYLTFRVMHEDSDGWQHPGIEAYELTRHVHDWLTQNAGDLLEEALNADVAALERAAMEAGQQ